MPDAGLPVRFGWFLVPYAADAPSELILVDVPMVFQPVGIWAGLGA